jgi:hypothetical protein
MSTRPAGTPDPIALECRALCRYLAGREPDEYVLESYRRLLPSAEAAVGVAPVDRLLAATASRGRALARMADVYARFFRPTGPLRRRVTLLLAILENAPGFFEPVSGPTIGSPVGVFLRVGRELAGTGLALGAGLLAFGPVHALGGGRSKR